MRIAYVLYFDAVSDNTVYSLSQTFKADIVFMCSCNVATAEIYATYMGTKDRNCTSKETGI